MGYFLRDGVRFHYEDVGAGAPLALSHAITRDARQVRQYIGTPLSCRVIRWDARGHGLTEPLGAFERLNFSCFADDLAALLDYLEIGRVILGGLSMGAATTVAFCCRWPSRVRAAILVRPAWLAEPHPKSLRCLELIGHLLRQNSLDEAREKFLESEEYRYLHSASPQAAEQILREFECPFVSERAAQRLQIIASAPIDSWQQLKACDMPMLVVGCTNDPFHPIEVAGKWVEHLPNARFEAIPSTFDNRDQHIHRLREVICSFLKSL
jgi:pimeloyl-ACP methyl ester carboxylesterase